MGGAENALMLKILVCWLKWVEGAAFRADITSEICWCLLQPKALHLNLNQFVLKCALPYSHLAT